MSFKNAIAYKGGNQYTVHVTKLLMDKFYGWLNWREDGMDSILDIGSGPGNTVRESIYPLLPPNFTKLVVSDISPQMVELQKKEFNNYNRVSCEVLDIGVDINEDLRSKLGTFDHITSFFCLMWVADQQKAMDNIYNLLKDRGDCLLVIVADTPILDALLSVCEKSKWKEYFTGWENYYPYPYTSLHEAEAKGQEFMRKAGFVETKADFLHYPFLFANDLERENFLRSMPNGIIKEVSAELEEEIFQERLKFFDKFNLGNYRSNAGRKSVSSCSSANKPQ
uniref:Putative juvenile hormone acid methyl transferase n=1 Tax=Nyssomyia neivai TaxID=330878 RepID=A0A1L8DL10_9DIPT